MEVCPICKSIIFGAYCMHCGYGSSSTDYEQFLTIAPVHGTSPSQRKYAWDEKTQNDIRCNACGGNWIRLSVITRECVCMKCGNNIDVDYLPQANSITTYKRTQRNEGLADTLQSSPIVAISAGAHHMVVVYKNGNVSAYGNNIDGCCDTDGIDHVIAASAGVTHTVYLREDGTVIARGNNSFGECNVGDWRDIKAVSVGRKFTVGVRYDGTVLHCGMIIRGFEELNFWNDITKISAGNAHIVGLKEGGTAVQAGVINGRITCHEEIVSVAAGSNETLVITRSGNVRSVAHNQEVWRGMIGVAVGKEFIAGLTKDGRVIVSGTSSRISINQINWTDIIAISAGDDYLVGLSSNGTIRIMSIGLSTSINHIIDLTGDKTTARTYNEQRLNELLNSIP